MGLFKPNIEKMSDKGNAKGLVRCLNRNKDWRIRRAAAEGLQKVRDAESLEPLIMALKDENAEVRKSVIAAITFTLAFGLFDRPWHRHNWGTRGLTDVRLAFEALTGMEEKRTHHERAIALLILGLKHADENVRIGSAIVLGILRREEAVPRLTEVLNDSEEQVRKEAAAALAKIERLRTNPSEDNWTTILRELDDVGCFDERIGQRIDVKQK